MTREIFASCPFPGCEGWEVQCFSPEEKERRQEAHKAERHPRIIASTESVTALVADDRMGQRERVAIEEAIRVMARKNGRVSANDVRSLLPSWVLPNRIGATFLAMSRPDGELVRVDRVPSTDTEGRNTHHDHNVYVLRTEMEVAS